MDMMRVSACTYPLREQDPAYAFEVIAAAGIHKVDLWGRMPQFSADLAVQDPQELLAKAARFGVRIANIGSYPGDKFGSEDPSEQEASMAEMALTIERAAQLGARSIRVRPGDRDDAALVDRMVPWFKRSAEIAESHGIYLGMENHQGSIAGNVPVCRDLCEKVGSRHFGVLYEPCNLMHGGVDYKEAFDAFKGYIMHLHVKDGRWVNGTFERSHVSEGDIDYGWVLESLASIGYEGDYALEYEICDIQPIETGLKKWVEAFRKL